MRHFKMPRHRFCRDKFILGLLVQFPVSDQIVSQKYTLEIYMSIKNSADIISSLNSRISSELGRIEILRDRNRNLAIIITGAIIGFAFKEPDFDQSLIMCFAAVIVSLLFWYQDYRLHRYRHGWHGVDKRLREYINDDLKDENFKFLDYKRNDERDASFFSKSSSFTYVILIGGALLLFYYKYKNLPDNVQVNSSSIKLSLSQIYWGDMATALAAFAAILAAISAFLSYKLSKSIYDEIKSDEIIIAGPLHHPGLAVPQHDDCVLRCTLFNKSKRKTYIKSVETTDQKGTPLEITWSDSIDELGNIQNPTGLLDLENSVNLVLRRNDGKSFEETAVYVRHSFSSNILVIKFDPLKEII